MIRTSAISQSALAGMECVALQNDHLRALFLPELGGKMISLYHFGSGREFLLQPPERTYRPAFHGASFASFDTSGFDECFPTVSQCAYPDGSFGGRLIPDHGDLWPVSWEFRVADRELCLTCAGRSLPYIFRKRIQLDQHTVLIKYEIESTGDEAFYCLWSAHPLLSIDPGCRILLPAEVLQVLVAWSAGKRLGKPGMVCGWPLAIDTSGAEVDLSEINTVSARTADKLFTSRLSEGCAALYYPNSGECICFRFDPLQVPYLGIWICQGAWPHPDNGHFTLALEPCTGRPDSLEEAIQRGECDLLTPGETKTWQLRIEILSAVPAELNHSNNT